MEAAFLVGRFATDRDAAGAQGDSRRRLPRFELRCSRCGYGVVVHVAPERCPMCAGSAWEHSRRLDGGC